MNTVTEYPTNPMILVEITDEMLDEYYTLERKFDRRHRIPSGSVHGPDYCPLCGKNGNPDTCRCTVGRVSVES